MGCSKRTAEMVLQALAKTSKCNTTFSMVRFGNVLGSSGSVVPKFRKQIEDGGPITVTHKEITRYFMSIPEAVQLVIQAGAMAKGGDVFVLDMGESVKITELAHKMIHLSGMSIKDKTNPDGDIEVKYTGLRPGEKLYEELLIGDNVKGTQHPRIMQAHEEFYTLKKLQDLLDRLKVSLSGADTEEIKDSLTKIVSGYTPWGTKKSTNEMKDEINTVVSFKKHI
jgi:FlaA1/EpsC-like NDP-sugar epimerase